LRRITSATIFSLLLIGLVISTFEVYLADTESNTIYVPDDHPTIQEAVNNASSRDTIFVKEGTYYENVVLDKPISLIGENIHNTIIDGNGTGHVIEIYAHSVNVKGFTIQRSGREWNENWVWEYWPDSGIFVHAHNCTISSNKIIDNLAGVTLFYSPANILQFNIIRDNSIGIGLTSGNAYDITSQNIIRRNNFVSNGLGLLWGIGIGTSNDNYIYHNNFVDNFETAFTYSTSVLDDGYPSGGNYWSDYNGTDLYSGPYQNESGSDGIGDTPYIISSDNTDNYPLMEPWTYPVGDINYDGQTNILDIMLAVATFGSTPEDPNWNADVDLAPQYGIIDIFDLVTLAYHYGERITP